MSPNPLDMEAIAIIGMACRFPGASTVEQFWRNLREGVESITFLSDAELERATLDPAEPGDPKYVKARGILEDIERFDARFFGFSPREAELTDPQQRVFLECAWEAFERAGYDAAAFPGPVAMRSTSPTAGTGPSRSRSRECGRCTGSGSWCASTGRGSGR